MILDILKADAPHLAWLQRAVAKDSRPRLEAIEVGDRYATAIDGFRLHVLDLSALTRFSDLRNWTGKLVKLLGGKVSRTKQSRVKVELVAGNYPDWMEIVKDVGQAKASTVIEPKYLRDFLEGLSNPVVVSIMADGRVEMATTGMEIGRYAMIMNRIGNIQSFRPEVGGKP